MSRVQTAFEEFLHRIELNDDRVRVAAVHYNAIKTAIENAIPGATVKRIGSFQRNTKLRPFDPDRDIDVDVLVRLGTFHTVAGPGVTGISGTSALERIRSALVSNGVYRVMDPVSDAPTVVLEYASDGFRLELVPAYEDLTPGFVRFGGPSCYAVVGRDGGWMPADYDYDAAFITVLNQHPVCGGALVPLIKLAKFYLRVVGSKLKSFHIELIVAMVLPAILQGWSKQGLRWEYQHAFCALLQALPEALRRPIQIPGSFSPPVDSELSLGARLVLERFFDDRAVEAYRLCFNVPKTSALQGWRTFFGDPFPASSTLVAGAQP